MTVSVLIPSYNAAGTIGRVLEALASQTVPPDEVILADSSTDETRRIVRSSRPDVKIIELPERSTPAVARNRAAAAAASETLVFLDSDAYPAADWLERLLEARRDGCRAGGGSIVLPDFQRAHPLALAQYYLQSNEFQPAGRRRKKPFLPACNFFCDRRLFEASGGFPEIRASEDTLFCLKLSKIVPVWFVPEARVHHVYRERWDGFFRAQTLTGRYIFLYRRDHYGDWYYRGAWPLFFLPAFLAIKFFRIAGRIFRAGPGPFFGWILCLPVFLVGLALWGWGFACAVPAARAKDAP